jgi:hypothetical protein
LAAAGLPLPFGHYRMRELISWRFVYWILGISFAGLALCKFLDGARGAFTRGGFGSVLVIVFSVAWCIGLVALLPLRIAWDKKHRDEVARQVVAGEIDPAQMSPLRQAAFYANYGSLPKWLYLPFLVVGVALTAIVALAIIGMVIWAIFFS